MAEIKFIVVGVDGSDSSRAALEWAYDEAAHHGAVLDRRQRVAPAIVAHGAAVRPPASGRL